MKNLALIVMALCVVQVSYAQTAVSSSINIGGKGDADTTDTSDVSVTTSSSQGNTLNPLSGAFGAQNFSDDQDGFLSFSGSLTATWASSASGNVSTANGWDIDTPYDSYIALNEYYTNLKAWTYTFTATQDSLFCLDYNVVGSGDTFGLQAWYFDFDGVGGGELLGNNFVFPDGAGTLVRSLVSGETYTVSLTNYGNVYNPNGVTAAGSSVGNFDWEIKPVPEPASMVVLGLGVLGLARRRRKS